MANKHTRCSVSSVIREMKNKTTMRCHHIPARMANLRNTGKVEENGTLIYWGNVKWYSHFGKFGSIFKELNINLHTTQQFQS